MCYHFADGGRICPNPIAQMRSNIFSGGFPAGGQNGSRLTEFENRFNFWALAEMVDSP